MNFTRDELISISILFGNRATQIEQTMTDDPEYQGNANPVVKLEDERYIRDLRAIESKANRMIDQHDEIRAATQVDPDSMYAIGSPTGRIVEPHTPPFHSLPRSDATLSPKRVIKVEPLPAGWKEIES